MFHSKNTHQGNNVFIGLRAVAVFEATKGAIVLLLGFGILALMHANLTDIAEQATGFLHIRPEGKLANVFVKLADHATDKTLWLLAAGALVYSAVRFTEAYGLWRQRDWAQWFALLSGAVYLPGELYSLLHHANLLKWFIFTSNVAIVLLMLALRVSSARHEHRKL